MSKTSYAILSFLLISLACTKLLHSQATREEQNMDYYEALMAKEASLKASLAQLTTEITALNETMSQFQGSTSMQIVALSDALADERYLISTYQQNHTLPLGLKSVNCANISTQDLDQIKISIQQIKGDLAALDTSINEMEKGVVTPDNFTSTCIQNLRIQKTWV